MNRDCWYYLIGNFISNREKHETLKLVCKSFYEIVERQTSLYYSRIKDRIYFHKIEKQGYKIYHNHFPDIYLEDNQYAWVLSPIEVMQNYETKSDNLYSLWLGEEIVINLEFLNLSHGALIVAKDCILVRIWVATQKDSQVQASLDIKRTSYSKIVYNGPFNEFPLHNFHRCTIGFSTVQNRPYIMVVVTIQPYTM